ncbi:MAG: hypothetical protein AAGC86_01290 [Pseudomonadota bacterium]
MRPAAVLILMLLAGCAASQDPAGQAATGGCLFWSTGCTRLDDPPPAAPLPAETRVTPAAGAPLAASLPQRDTLPADDLGRVRAAHSPRVRDTAGEASFDARFAGEQLAPPAETVYPLPSNCTSPPSSLLRNSPGGRFAPGRNSAAAGAYASAYARCGQPGTWPRPE